MFEKYLVIVMAIGYIVAVLFFIVLEENRALKRKNRDLRKKNRMWEKHFYEAQKAGMEEKGGMV